MGKIKEYVYSPDVALNKNHKIVKAAHQKGLTNIKITWYPFTTCNPHLTGWVLESDQIKWMRIYGNVPMVISKIKSWAWKGEKLIC